MKPSRFHSNRGPHNWLIYDVGDRFLEKHSQHYKGHLVDLGCGEAPFKEYFLQFSTSYTGVDWTKTLHNSNADLVSDLNRKIELDDGVADSIISLSVMEHLCEPQVFLNESYRILKNQGVMILQVPWQWHIHEAPHDYFRYTPHGLKYMLEKSGFVDIEIEPQSGFFTARALKLNYFLARSIYKLPKYIMYPLAGLLLPIWTLTQVMAPLLDKLDNDWEREAVGFIVTAKKI